jgi:hypothetical protein
MMAFARVLYERPPFRLSREPSQRIRRMVDPATTRATQHDDAMNAITQTIASSAVRVNATSANAKRVNRCVGDANATTNAR